MVMWLCVVLSVVAIGLVGYARLHGRAVLSVQTGSMQPAIRPGDAVVVRNASAALTANSTPSNLRVGDIVTFWSPSQPDTLITHRIVNISPASGMVITKGDALDAPDTAINADAILGKVEHIVPGAGYGLSILRRPIGLAAAVYLPAAVLIYGEISRLMHHYDRRFYRLAAYRLPAPASR